MKTREHSMSWLILFSLSGHEPCFPHFSSVHMSCLDLKHVFKKENPGRPCLVVDGCLLENKTPFMIVPIKLGIFYNSFYKIP